MRNKEEVACTLCPTHPFSNTHTEGKGENPKREAHRHTHQQARTPPAEGQESNPGSVCLNGGRIFYLQLPAPPLPQRGMGKLVVRHARSADTSLLWDRFKAI